MLTYQPLADHYVGLSFGLCFVLTKRPKSIVNYLTITWFKLVITQLCLGFNMDHLYFIFQGSEQNYSYQSKLYEVKYFVYQVSRLMCFVWGIKCLLIAFRGEYFTKSLITFPWWYSETFPQIYMRHKANPFKLTNSSPILDILGKLFPDIYRGIL